MWETQTRTPASDANVPEDLAVLTGRLSRLGLRVSLPTVGPDTPLPELEQLKGTPLSAMVVQSRR
jgi:hypothetical protein